MRRNRGESLSIRFQMSSPRQFRRATAATSSIVLVVAGLIGGVVAASPAYASCTYTFIRSSDAEVANDYVQGDSAEVLTPDASQVYGYNVFPISADVGINNGIDFVQVGWYLGSPDNLPFASTPTTFFGEYDADSKYLEDLQQGPTIGWNTDVTFEITRNLTNLRSYSFLVNGIVRAMTLKDNHFEGGEAQFLGEIDDSCSIDWAEATQPSSPYSTLEYQLKSGSSSTWYLFWDDDLPASGWTDIQIEGRATNLDDNG
jgi:hypothetical protein